MTTAGGPPITRRQSLALIASAAFFPPFSATAAEQTLDRSRLEFLHRLPPENRVSFADDAKLLVGWVTDAAASDMSLHAGRIVDGNSGFSSVPGFAEATAMAGLTGRYEILAAPKETNSYYGVLFGLLDASGAQRAIVLVNRLFRLPLLLQDPLGVVSDLGTNAGMLIGFGTSSLDTAFALANQGDQLARRLGVPFITAGQSQAGGTAQLQIASIKDSSGSRGFVTFNATCSSRSVLRLGADPSRVPGVNFAKDLDPLVGPHSLLANDIGQQIYLHADGSWSLTPKSSFLRAAFHPGEHLLSSFNQVHLSPILSSVL